MPLSTPSFVTAALAGALILGNLSACGVTAEAEAEDELEKASVSANIETVIVTPDPCIGCAEARVAAANARVRAMAQAAAEAEARARRQRDAQTARISACVSQRSKDLKVCSDTSVRAGQGLAADEAACNQRAATGCAAGNTTKQIATCVGNARYGSEELRRSCVNAIPATAPESVRAQAAGSCFTREFLDGQSAAGFCNGAANYDGRGSLRAFCTAKGEYNCVSNHFTGIARNAANRVACVAVAESQFLDCLLPGV